MLRINAKILGGGKCTMMAKGNIELGNVVRAEGMMIRKQSPSKVDLIFYINDIPVDLSISKVGDPESEALLYHERPLKALKRAALAASLEGEEVSEIVEFINTWADTDRWLSDLRVALEIGACPKKIIENLGLPADTDPEHLLEDLGGRFKDHVKEFVQKKLEKSSRPNP